MRVIATLHDARIPIGTLGELAEALRPLADGGMVWASVIDGRICVVCDDQARPAATAEPSEPVDELAEYEAEFRAAWAEQDGAAAAVAKTLGEPLHTVIRTARRLGLTTAATPLVAAGGGT